MDYALRIGFGTDLHTTDPARKLFLGGVEISDAGFGLQGHSDADALLHAICDAILGALGAGDIGELFPDTDERHRDRASADFLTEVLQLARRRGFAVVNLDCTIHAQRPRLGPWKERIRENLARLTGLPRERVNVKAKTGEKLGPVGECKAIAADAIVLLSQKPRSEDG